MQFRTSDQIRNDFLEFFREKGHAIVPSAPVVPLEDPTLLFTNAGMNQFKPIFLGEEPGYSDKGKMWQRAADTQKCIRVSGKHNDLEEVGHDTYHHTLFEMLGNWSFGDYFKEEAIRWAWELLVDKWGLDSSRLYATVFGGDEQDGLPADEEAEELWKKVTKINPDHVLRFGKKDNFWEMGETGPCGPCSEIHVDLRSDEERATQPGSELVNADDPRVMEIWNLVFIQFNRTADGSLKTLPAKHVDTGMGFERICAVIQKKTSNYDSDVFTPIIKHISKLAAKPYGDDDQADIAMRVIADHIRAVAFSIADGASPSNDGRGYVVRRILRRAIRYGWDKLGLKEPFMNLLVPTLAKQFAGVFPELQAQHSYVQGVIEAEEKGFLRTLGQGIEIFNKMTEGKSTISGEDAFRLHDTYGFPIDLTALMAREKGLAVDEMGFTERMKEQKDRARSSGKFKVDLSSTNEWVTVNEGSDSHFVGYDFIESTSKIMAARKEGDRNAVLLDETPFYAESGGQVADFGILTNGDVHVRVVDVQKNQGKIVHYLDHMPEDLSGTWTARVDAVRRLEVSKHHSATHLLHAALRQVLGTHVTQKGSLVEESRLRFDFSHFKSIEQSELDDIESIVNRRIQENIHLLEERDVPIDTARAKGAMMLFGEKYGDHVRVITFDPAWSVELCGGTHVNATGKIGYFRFVSENSVASGVRRVEAVAGHAADDALRAEKREYSRLLAQLGQTSDPVETLQSIIDDRKRMEKELEVIRMQRSISELVGVLGSASAHDGVTVATGEITGADTEVLKQLGYESLKRSPVSTVTVLGSRDDANGKVYLVATVTDDLIASKSLKAGQLVGALARELGGGGGGQPNLATAGGRLPEKLGEVLASVPVRLKG
jgi:alanyl-tRNA synthetase